MKIAAQVALVCLAALALPGREAQAEDTVHACIAASTEGQTLRKDGKLLAAREQLLECARDACPAIVRSHCARWLADLEQQIPSVVVRAQDEAGVDLLDARLAIDGTPQKLDGRPVSLDPGEHTVVVEHSQWGRREVRVLLVEGERARVLTLRFQTVFPPKGPPPGKVGPPEPPPRERHVPLGAWVLGGVGVLSLGAGGAFALVTNNDLDGLKSSCSPHCSQAATNPGRTHEAIAYVSLGVGAAALAGGLVWALAFPSRRERAEGALRLELRPIAGGAFAGLSVSY